MESLCSYPQDRGFVRRMTEHDDIDALLVRIAKGDRAAFAALYHRTSARLFGIVLRVLQDRDEAELVLQEVYIRIWHKAGSYHVNGLAPMTWLTTLSRNLALDHRRRHLHRLNVSTHDNGPAGDTNTASPAPPRRTQFHECVEQLPEEGVELLRSVYLDGKNYHDLVAELGVDISTLRSWMRGSLLKLRECLCR